MPHTQPVRTARFILLGCLAILLAACGGAASRNTTPSLAPDGGTAQTPTMRAASAGDSVISPSATAVGRTTPTTESATAVDVGAEQTPVSASATPAACEPVIITDPVGAADLHELAWFSSAIVVGTVTNHGEPYTVSAFQREVLATDFQVDVGIFVRGQAADSQEVTVRQFGTPDGCPVLHGDPAFAVGDRVVLFLWNPGDDAGSTANRYPVGQLQGVWHVSADNIATSRDPYLAASPLPLGTLLADARTSLQGNPPTGDLAEQYVVSTYDAPLGWVPPTVVPECATTPTPTP